MLEQDEEGQRKRASVELFAGGGGLACGVEAAGFRPLLLNEFDRRACETLRLNGAEPHRDLGDPPIPEEGQAPPLVEGDVRLVSFKYLKGRVDLLAGGPPCQPFSLGGVAKGDEDNRNMFPQMFRAVREIRPKVVICENVRGLLRPSFAPYFDYIQRELELPFTTRAKGATWRDHDALLRERGRSKRIAAHRRYLVERFPVNAADYGVPQIRHRVILVAFRADLRVDVERFKKLVETEYALYSETELYRSMRDGRYWERHNDVPKHVRDRVMERIPKTLPEPDGDAPRPWRTLRDALKGIGDQTELPPVPVKLMDRKTEIKGIKDHIGWPDARIYDGHTPNELDRPAKTVKAGVHGVPGGESVVMLDDGSHRYMTVRETARVMTFPDDHQLDGPRGEKMRQLGNAVPVLLGEAFAKAVANALDHAGH
ncbi:DNA cytosine methyltransferase [Actinomadura sp. NAK00032]|uniref:DNA cytosine methyltransferase n=1 Tax=Actinomadura sp. NAK00032 TaxID=2742128 RepID=UPI001591A5CF|nr:DNA cytosine methyltransferase [Actinomadura sp. NAK00032]QKW33293.1 DNA cytosine methyltransferase [Actinomadura sp. NAK00032]